MSGFLLDTNCISEPLRTKPDEKVLAWLNSIDERLLYLSVLTVGELRKGTSKLPEELRRSRLEQWLEQLSMRFGDRILPIDRQIAERWGRLSALAESKGRKLATIDSLLAATALEHNLAIATRNTNDFSNTSVTLINPWL